VLGCVERNGCGTMGVTTNEGIVFLSMEFTKLMAIGLVTGIGNGTTERHKRLYSTGSVDDSQARGWSLGQRLNSDLY